MYLIKANAKKAHVSAQVNGIRQFAIQKGADLVYIPTTKVGGMDSNVAMVSDSLQ